MSQEFDSVSGGNTTSPGKYLKGHQVSREAVYLRQRCTKTGINLCQISVTDSFCLNSNNASGYGFNLAIYFIHVNLFSVKSHTYARYFSAALSMPFD